jgi:hypothetical protein
VSVEEGANIESEGRQPASRKIGVIRSHQQLIGMIILSAAFIIGSFSVASGVRNRNQPQSNRITITGSAEQAVTSNTFQWMASVASTQPTTSAALAQLNGWTSQIRNALIAAGALLLAKNVPFIANQPQYTFNGLKKLRPALTKEAAANARQRAQAALGKHVTLGKPISITVGQVSVDAPGSVNYGSGDFNTNTIPKVVSVVVYATYSTG